MAIRQERSFSTFLLAALVAVCVIMPAISAHAANTSVVLYASKAPVRAGSWVVVSDSTAAGGSAMKTAVSATKIASPLASPANYFQMTFPASSGQAYHLWIRGKAANNSYNHDSAYIQFSDSISSTGAAVDRIGTTSAAAVVLQGCTGGSEEGWGGEGNGWGGTGADNRFQTTGAPHNLIQLPESGFENDQIVLS